MATIQPDIREIFYAALDRQSPKELSRYLDEVCGSDTAIRAEVEALLDSHRQAGNFMGGTSSSEPDIIDKTPAESLGRQIGPLKLLQVIGEGGMGVVYLAEQREPVER